MCTHLHSKKIVPSERASSWPSSFDTPRVSMSTLFATSILTTLPPPLYISTSRSQISFRLSKVSRRLTSYTARREANSHSKDHRRKQSALNKHQGALEQIT